MRIVLDTNVIVSACLSSTGPPARIFDEIKDQTLFLYLSPEIVDEVSRVFQYDKIANRLSLERRKESLQTLGSIGFFVETESTVTVSVDSDDNMFLEAALKASAQFVVSGDPDLTNIKDYRGIKILRPDSFITLIESDEPTPYLPKSPPEF